MNNTLEEFAGKVYSGLERFERPPSGSVVSVGNFDGVHLGHQTILAQARRIADQESLPLVALTFEPAPVCILRPQEACHILTPLPIKIRLLLAQNVDQVIVLETTRELLALDPEEFASRILVDRLHCRHIVEGQTFSFGRRRCGTLLSLDRIGGQLGFEAHLVAARTLAVGPDPAVAVCSTLIRQRIMTGRVDKAVQYLGRDYLFSGRIVRGQGRGSQLGFPTANLAPDHPEQLVCEDGVYAGFAQYGESLSAAWQSPRRHPAAISIGRCQTFEDGRWQIEAHLLDPDEKELPAYGQSMLLHLRSRVRPQRKFAGADELTQAIAQDC
ncbi:MAG: bifunctional riboflavin kinase/FMN adenylyltransferase, partial [Sedimentisphaerales bacterium]|nr:bifunctional riboflavin kinase/FMN adenylyltransferase [Sedimentisphaerales bacterium]